MKYPFPTSRSPIPSDMGLKSCPENAECIKEVGGTTNKSAANAPRNQVSPDVNNKMIHVRAHVRKPKGNQEDEDEGY